MTDLRDTKFQGFAKLLCDDMFNNFVVMSEERRHFMEAAMPIFERIIAQRAYDLAVHILDNLSVHNFEPYTYEVAKEEITEDDTDLLSHIPDLTQWSESPDSE